MKTIIPSGVLGGLALFVWSFIAHLPPIGTAGERTVLPEQGDVLLRTMTGVLRERAIYVLPGMGEDKQAWLARFEQGPAAIVAYNPRPAEQAVGGRPFATWILIELATAILSGLLGAIVATSLARTLGYWSRVLVLASIGLIATIDIDASYWNWFAFPTSFLFAQLVDHVGGWFVAGLVMAWITRADGPARS